MLSNNNTELGGVLLTYMIIYSRSEQRRIEMNYDLIKVRFKKLHMHPKDQFGRLASDK